jgi:hypothetical protein
MRKFLVLLIITLATQLPARHLQPGFTGNEFRKMLEISGHQSDTGIWPKLWMPYPTGYTLAYRSEITALDNRWDLWTGKDSIDVISIRGTMGSFDSWLENFYAGMIPAIGTLKLGNGREFNYKVANDSAAFVHIGWMIALAYMADDVMQKINSEYEKGVRDFYIMGHSQGGAIGYLLTSYLYYQSGKGIPAGITFKTFGSGVPKPGNLFYAYDFDFITRGGWAFRVVNTADWVPEVPFSLQTLDDLSAGNPFEDMGLLMKNSGRVPRWYAKHLVKKMNRSAKRARKKFSKYLSHKSGKYVRRRLEGFPKQKFQPSLYYEPCAIPIVLPPDDLYRKLYPNDSQNIFRHHGFGPYLYLVNTYYPVK